MIIQTHEYSQILTLAAVISLRSRKHITEFTQNLKKRDDSAAGNPWLQEHHQSRRRDSYGNRTCPRVLPEPRYQSVLEGINQVDRFSPKSNIRRPAKCRSRRFGLPAFCCSLHAKPAQWTTNDESNQMKGSSLLSIMIFVSTEVAQLPPFHGDFVYQFLASFVTAVNASV